MKITKRKYCQIVRTMAVMAYGLIFMILPLCSIAQDHSVTVRGNVTDETGNSLAAVSVRVKGQPVSTLTDQAGNFNVQVSDGTAILVFSAVGYQTTEVEIQNRQHIDVQLATIIQGLDEVVVTALGVSREKRTLGYATQQLDERALNEAPATNFLDNLGGKVAGVQMSSSGTVGGSTRLTIRGESSLSLQNNQPLMVIDGAPVANDGVNNTSGNADYGNSAGALNPADIESINVLKGPAAAALYGSRAANGAIVITTKKGMAGRGVGISVNSYYFVNEVGRLPEFQNEFGGGRQGVYRGSNFGANWSIYPSGEQDSYDESWGPRLNTGVLHAQFDSPTTNGLRGGDVALDNRGDIIPTPWVSQPNNVRDFFETGTKAYNNVAFSGSNEKSRYRLSLTSLNENGVIPNDDLDRYQINLNSEYKLSERLTTGIRFNYAKTKGTNRPDNGYGRNTVMYFFTWMNRNVNMNSFRDYWQSGFEGLRQFQYNYGENHANPFFLQYENTKGQDKDHVYGNMDLKYDITDKLSFQLRSALDYYHDFRPLRWGYSDVSNPQGRYEEVKIQYMERNTDFLLSYQDEISAGDISYRLSFGGNRFDLSGNTGSTTAPSLLIPGIYSLGNTNAQLLAYSYRSQKRINSLYGMANFGYKDLVFVDLTLRNDWSSTLPPSHNSYLYPSVGLNTNLKEVFSIGDIVSQSALRFSWAQVGNDASPYQILNTFDNRTRWGNNAALAGPGSLANAQLKPELTSTYEIGTVWGLFANRLVLDVTYYDIRSKNQIMNLPLVLSSGYSARAINAGEVQNKGMEVMLSATPISTQSGFRWDLSINWARNVGKVLALNDEVDKVVQAAPGENASIQAREGERMGAIWGPGYVRVPDGPMKGDIIILPNGNAERTSEDIYLGNVNPDWTGGISNRLTYGNVSLSALIAGQVGGHFISRFYNKAVGSGMLIESLEGRAARPVGQEYDSPYYIPGAARMDDGSYQPNNISTDGTFSDGVYGTDVRYFFKGRMDHNSEAQLFSTTYFKLRELSLAYNLPTKWFGSTSISNARLAITGRNLFLWTPKGNRHFDPEVAVATAGNGLIPGFENMSLPSTREFGLSLNLSF